MELLALLLHEIEVLSLLFEFLVHFLQIHIHSLDSIEPFLERFDITSKLLAL